MDNHGTDAVDRHANAFVPEAREPFLDNLSAIRRAFVRPYLPGVEHAGLPMVEADETLNVLLIDGPLVGFADSNDSGIDFSHTSCLRREVATHLPKGQPICGPDH